MSVANGQVANATTFNDAFISRTVNSNTTAKINLNDADAVSGTQITNVQRELNKLNSFLGSTPNTLMDTLPTWTNNDVGLSTDTVKIRTDNLTEKFNTSTGHAHDGTPGNGAPISASSLADFNKYWSEFQTTTFASAAGLSDDVTTEFSGETPGGGVATVGVPTTAPYNKVELRTDPAGDQIEEPGGKKVYGRLTESSGTWTLTYYYQDSLGVETAYSLPSQDIRIYFREVFDSSTRPTFATEDGFIGSLDATADVVDASSTQRGVVSIGAQAFAGVKTFDNGAVMSEAISLERTDVASGGTVTALTSTYSFVKLTGASTTEVQGIVGPSTAKLLVLYNASSGDLTIKHQNAGATAVNRIITSDAADLVLSESQSVQLIYDTGASRWRVATSVGGGGGGVGYQESIGTGDGVTTDFGPLTLTPTDEDSIIVFRDSIIVDKSEWALSGADISFSVAPAAAQNIYVWYMTNGTPVPMGPTGTQNVEYRTLSGGEAAAESLTLSATPISASKVMVDVIGGCAQEYSVDFTVSGTTLSWAGLGLAGLVAGDKLRINYLS